MSDLKGRAALWRARRWWRSISPGVQPTPAVLADHIRARIAYLDREWDERCTETSDLVTGFVDDLVTSDLGPAGGDRFTSIAEKLRWRELRALLISHVATEVITRINDAARPLLEQLERVELFDHTNALTIGDLPAFDRLCAALAPDDLVPQAYQVLVDAIERRQPTPVNSFLAVNELPTVDGELQSLLEADPITTAGRLERTLSLRANALPRVVVDLVGVEPMIELALEEETIDRDGA